MSNEIDDLLAGGGAAGKGLKFDTVGTAYSGVVVSADKRAFTNIQTGSPEFWEDGKPKEQIVIGIQTDQRDPAIENDDGVRYDYIKAWGVQLKALREAARQAGGSPAVGDTYSVKFVREEPSKTRGFNPTKVYEYGIKKGNPLDATLTGGDTAKAPDAFPSGLTDAQKAQAGQLIGLGLDDAKIAQVVEGADPVAIAAYRLELASVGSKGF